MKVPLEKGDALIVVDVQNDFLPGGRLAVPQGDEVIAPLNRYLALFHASHLPMFATRDGHPFDHCSFQAQGGIWPVHCVAGTPGAEFPSALKLPPEACILSKATEKDKEAYSGFTDTRLDEMLQSLHIKRLFIGGLATDYCVRRTVEDALHLRYVTYLLLDAVRAVNIKPDDGRAALEAMVSLGAHPISIQDCVA